MKDDSNKMKWYTLAFIAFSGVWGFGNITNGFVYSKNGHPIYG